MFQNTERYVIPFPELSSQQQNLNISIEEQKNLEVLIEDQYIKIRDIGIDYIEDKNIDPCIYQNLVIFINDNYVPIVQFEEIISNERHLLVFGKILYSFLILDLYKTILPKLISSGLGKSSIDLRYLNIDEWKYHLSLAVTERIRSLNIIRQTSDNIDLQNEQFKFTYYLDLIDNDITGLIESFIIPMINLYFVEIDSFTI